jgi:4-amino-4-deoxy-L-arabinose transferase-like glycosyltransferase
MIQRSRKLTFEIDRPLVALVIISLLIRVVFLLVYQPATFDDTLGYIDTGRTLQALDFESYNAARTPVYPLLMVATGFDPQFMWLLQSLMGLAIAVMLYLLARYHVANNRIAFAIGLSYSLAINLLFFEAALLTETLSTFLLLLSLLFFILSRRRKGRLFFYMATAVVASLAVLTRPLMLLLVPLYLLFFIHRWNQRRYDSGRWVRYLVGFGLPVAVLLGGAILFNGLYTGSFTFSTLTGYNLAGHSGAFMEHAPEEYATIRDIYLKHREARIAATGTHIWTIWDAQGEMSQATGLDFVELNDALTKLSLQLIATHPFLYLQNVAIAWAKFWASAVLWDLDTLSVPIDKTIVTGLWWMVRWLLIFINFTFLLVSLYSLYERRRKNRLLDYDAEFHWLALTLVLGTSLLQALLIFADNWRFSVPYQPLIIYVVIIWLWLFGLRWEQRRARS